MNHIKANKFSAKIEIIGINPFVYLPDHILRSIFLQAKREKGKIPVKIKIEGHEFLQTLIKYSGHWRLYLNTPMRKKAQKETGDMAVFEIEYDPDRRTIITHPALVKALDENEDAKKIFNLLAPSLQLEIIRYVSFLKAEKSITNNVEKIIDYLRGKGKFLGRSLINDRA